MVKKIIFLFFIIFIFTNYASAGRIHDEARLGRWEAVKEILCSFETLEERQKAIDSMQDGKTVLDIVTSSGIEGSGSMADWIIKLLLGEISVESNPLFRSTKERSQKNPAEPLKVLSRQEILEPIRQRIVAKRKQAQEFLEKYSQEERNSLREIAIESYGKTKEQALKNSKKWLNSSSLDNKSDKKIIFTLVCSEEGSEFRVIIYFHPHIDYGGESIIYSAFELYDPKAKNKKNNSNDSFLILKEKRKPKHGTSLSEKKFPDELSILKYLKLNKAAVNFEHRILLFLEDNGIPINNLPSEIINEVCLEILKKMDEVHNKNILHLDFKHENVLIFISHPDNAIKISLCDYGSACHMDDAHLHTNYETTDIFVPPEYGQQPDIRTDMFQIGRLIIMLLTNFNRGDYAFNNEREAAYLRTQEKLFEEAETRGSSMDPVRLRLIGIAKTLVDHIGFRPGKNTMTGLIRDLEELMTGKSFESDNVAITKKSSSGKLLLPLDKIKRRSVSPSMHSPSSGSSSPSSGNSTPIKCNRTPPTSSRMAGEGDDKSQDRNPRSNSSRTKEKTLNSKKNRNIATS